MGGTKSKPEPLVQEKGTIDESSGFHILEIHMPTVGVGIGSILLGCGFLVIGLMIFRYLKRKVRNQPPKLRVDKIDPSTGLPYHHPVSRQVQGLMPLGMIYPGTAHQIPNVGYPGAFGMLPGVRVPRTPQFDNHRFQDVEAQENDGDERRQEDRVRPVRNPGQFHDLATRDRLVV